MSTPVGSIEVFTFSPAWGLPTSGPFRLKLEACLRSYVDRALATRFPAHAGTTAVAA